MKYARTKGRQRLIELLCLFSAPELGALSSSKASIGGPLTVPINCLQIRAQATIY